MISIRIPDALIGGTRRLLLVATLGAAFLFCAVGAPAQSGGRPSPGGPQAGRTAPAQRQEPANRLEPGAAVVLHGRTLSNLRECIGAYDAQECARGISDRLSRLSQSQDEELPALRLEERNGVTILLAGDTEIMAVTNADARAAGEDRAAYAQRLAAILTEPLSAEKREFSWRSLAQGAVFEALATVVICLFFVFTRRALRGLVWWIYEQKDKRIHAIRFQKTELLSARRITRLLAFTARRIWVFLLLFALYLDLPIVFRFSAYTPQISDQIIDYTLTPVRVLWGMFLAEIPNLFFLLVISVIAHYLARLARFLFQEISEERIAFTGFFRTRRCPLSRSSGC